MKRKKNSKKQKNSQFDAKQKVLCEKKKSEKKKKEMVTAVKKSNVDVALEEAGAKLRAMLSAADCLKIDNRRATSALVMCGEC
jgi:hypothetical protein